MSTQAQREDVELVRSRVTLPLPLGAVCYFRYGRLQDTLTILIGTQDRWAHDRRTDSDSITTHLDAEGLPVRIELQNASTIFPLEWLIKHDRRSGPQMRHGDQP